MPGNAEKTRALLRFLKDQAALRRKRIAAYQAEDKVLWFSQLPRNLPPNWADACKTPFLSDTSAGDCDFWLEVRKKRQPPMPPVPDELRPWVPQKFQDSPQDYLDIDELLDILNRRINVPTEKRLPNGLTETTSEERCLDDYPEVQTAWLDYLGARWEPWAQEYRWWTRLQQVYETVDFMRRRLEEAEERYELVLGVGLLQWRDPSGVLVKRHVLTAPCEITLDAARGVLTVIPAESFETFRVELDMLEIQHRPQLDQADLNNQLAELDIFAWERALVAGILRTIANKARPNAEVVEDNWAPLERADETLRIVYAPALVLRERRPTAYDDLIERLLNAEREPDFATTSPWDRLVSEGETPDDPAAGQPLEDFGPSRLDHRVYFPRPTNEEQRQIAERLKTRPYVLVKGPPGTGKSHTIANLICHLLAGGERVLVTAQAPKALAVLRDLLPDQIATLCVTAFGSSREDHRLLEESVRQILAQKNKWLGEEWASREADRLERELARYEREAAEVARELRQCREAETHTHARPGGYSGTAAQIAKQIQERRDKYGWFPELPDHRCDCPLLGDEIAFVGDVHATLTAQQISEISLQAGTFSLPDPSEFARALEELTAAEQAAQAALTRVSGEQLGPLQSFSDATLDDCKTFLVQLEQHAVRAARILGDLIGNLLKDLLVGQDIRWERLRQEGLHLAEKIRAARQRVGVASVELPSELDLHQLAADATRRFEHFQYGGRRGWGPFAPRIVRETRYVEKCCRVNGVAPREQRSLEILVAFLELEQLLECFRELWPVPCPAPPADPKHAASEVCDLVECLDRLLDFFRNHGSQALQVIPLAQRSALAEADHRARWCRLIEAELVRRRLEQARKPLRGWLDAIRSLDPKTAHPCITQLAEAIEHRSLEAWREAWSRRQKLLAEKDRFQRYQCLIGKLRAVCPALADLVESTQGDSRWTDRLRRLEEAWHWAAAKTWLRKVADPQHYESLLERRLRLQQKIETALQELAAHKAWRAFFRRLDSRTEQSLIAWTKAVARIGKGTGKFAHRHRRAARQYLLDCIPKIPAWIMPLHKVWETTDPVPGIFDTVIVDEASQAGVEALVLLLLSKRIIVVGDDKQNSPEAVGVQEDDVARLARDHLRQFRFRDEFRPDTSLYDHAERAFGNVISLREHFRCVPEIIRFSNDLCYRDSPLIPLRQPPPIRLRPLERQFVIGGFCEGEAQRIVNRPEAQAIVNKIEECLRDERDERYKGKTMGVIALQGHAQAELIESELAKVLEPGVRQQRKLRCGVPATFQGDERDVMFLSLVIAPNHRFRALTELEAQRRFNVAMSRARDQVWIFHSIELHDLSPHDLRRRLLNFFESPAETIPDANHEELTRLERELKRLSRAPGLQPEPYESWFEADVALELLRKGYRIRPQFEAAGYRIDLVIEGVANRLAVECDGDAWHGPDRFDYDMARQRQLERAGWRFVRIRESEFYADPNHALQRITEACDELEIRPAG